MDPKVFMVLNKINVLKPESNKSIGFFKNMLIYQG